MRDFLIIMTGILQTLCMIPYIAGILRGDSKPMKSTWFIWATLDVITLSSMYMKGEMNIQIIIAVLSASSVALLSLKYGQPGLSRIDKVCLSGAVLAIALWAVSGNPLLALICSLSATLIGMIPTAVSAWQVPSRENRLAWTIGTAASICSVLTVKEWEVAASAQPIVFLVINFGMMPILYLRQYFIRPRTV